ncbi:MAG: Crp/Fnr family transcriptional regulator [Tunicatimonas sp.]
MNIDLIQLRQVFHIGSVDLSEEIVRHGTVHRFLPGDTLIDYGRYIKTVPLVLSGSVKVIRQDEAGREVFLYYLKPGETCAMSLTYCSAYQPSLIKAVAEEETTVMAVPVEQHERWMNDYREWKELVATTYAVRFQELLHTIDSIAFKKMDERLLEYLHRKFEQLGTHELAITHQEIANELGTSREVISRLLKQLEKHDIVRLGRNRILRNQTTVLAE